MEYFSLNNKTYDKNLSEIYSRTFRITQDSSHRVAAVFQHLEELENKLVWHFAGLNKIVTSFTATFGDRDELLVPRTIITVELRDFTREETLGIYNEVGDDDSTTKVEYSGLTEDLPNVITDELFYEVFGDEARRNRGEN